MNGFQEIGGDPSPPSTAAGGFPHSPVPGGSISFTINHDPVPFARARSNGAQRFTAPRQRKYSRLVEQAAVAALKDHVRFARGVPLLMSVQAVWKFPAAFKAAERVPQWRPCIPDADNVAKIIADACNGIVYADDGQIVALHVTKEYGPSACVKVSFIALDPLKSSPATG